MSFVKICNLSYHSNISQYTIMTSLAILKHLLLRLPWGLTNQTRNQLKNKHKNIPTELFESKESLNKDQNKAS